MLTWIEKKVNNIESNPRDFWFAIDVENVFGKKSKSYRAFIIKEQYPSKDGVTICKKDDPELYVLFETRVSECDEEYEDLKSEYRIGYTESELICPNGNRYFDSSKSTFIRAFKTLDEAKNRVEYNIQHIRNLIDTYFGLA